MNRAVLIAITGSTLSLAACDEPGASAASKPSGASARPLDPRALTADKLSPFPDSERLRAQFRSLGQELPPLLTVIRRKGRDFPGFEVTSHQAIPTWERLRKLTDQTGLYPLVIRDDHDMLQDFDEGVLKTTPEDYLAAAATLDAEAWIQSRRDDPYREEELPYGPKDDQAAPLDRFTVPYESLSGKPIANVFIILLPTRDGCEFPAYLAYGGWNACPNPEEHIAILRYWRDRYGAEPVTCGGDVIELRVPEPLKSRQQADHLAEEMFLYCTDIVDQGVGSINALAHSLTKGRIWFFWWD